MPSRLHLALLAIIATPPWAIATLRAFGLIP